MRPELIPSESQTKEIAEILGLDPETLNKELRRFYEDRKRELKKRIEGDKRISEYPNKKRPKKAFNMPNWGKRKF